MPEVRPIDANALHAKIFEENRRNYAATENVAQILLRIETEPTLEAEPVRHGRWIEETEPDENGNVVAMCNQCYHTDEHGVNMKIPYCWYCGARMDLTNKNVYEKE